MASKVDPKKPRLDLAWIKLQNGTLRVDLESATVEAWHPRYRRWQPIKVFYTNDTAIGSSGYAFIYLTIRMGDRRFRQSALLHRVVKMATCCERLSADEQVDHLDFNKRNNAYWNLEVVTPAENIRRRDARDEILMAQPDYDPWAEPAAVA